MLARLLRRALPRQGATSLRSTIKQTASRRQFSNYEFEDRVLAGAATGAFFLDVGIGMGLWGGAAYGLYTAGKKSKDPQEKESGLATTMKYAAAGTLMGVGAATAATATVALPEVVIPSVLFYGTYRALKNNSKKEEPKNALQNTPPSATPKPKP